MDEKELKEALARLPKILGGTATAAQDHQIIEENKEGCHFKITKEMLPVPPWPVFYMFSISGLPRNRRRLIRWFIKILGKPKDRIQMPNLPHIDYISWEAERIDQRT